MLFRVGLVVSVNVVWVCVVASVKKLVRVALVASDTRVILVGLG